MDGTSWQYSTLAAFLRTSFAKKSDAPWREYLRPAMFMAYDVYFLSGK